MGFEDTVFLTGFPGFIGGRLVERLAREGARFFLLVQPSLADRAREQVRQLLELTGADEGRFILLKGDITQENFGLSPRELSAAEAEATVIFHLAALYDLAVERDVAMRINVDGTRAVNAFARKLPKLNRYHYVSTCYVAGLRTGLILESELHHHAGFRNYYEESKYLAEIEVDTLKGELPITIHRPSVVCGDSQTGETAKYDGIYYLINYLRMLPDVLSIANIGNREVKLNVVPVDFVVDAMIALAKDERAVGATVQLADPDPLTTHELFDTISRELAGRPSRLTLPARLVQTTLNLKFSEMLTGLPRVGAPYFFIRQTYDTTRSQELLEPHEIRCPRFSDYVDKLIDYAVNRENSDPQ